MKRRNYVIALSVILLLVLIWWAAREHTVDGFPEMPPGRYSGAFSDLGQEKEQTTGFYVEVMPDQRSMVFAVLREGWKPQLVPLQKDQKVRDPNSHQLLPVQIRYAGQTYRMYGEKNGDFYAGYVLSEDKREGRWELRPLPEDAIDSSAKAQLGEEFDLNRWSYLKAQQRILDRSIERNEKVAIDSRDKYEQLVKYLNDGETLKARALERRDELQQQVEKAKKDYEVALNDVSKEYASLSVLGRITKRGKAVELARRVASREDRWYLANWQEGDSYGGMEEFLGDAYSVDLGRLEADYRRAREVNMLVEEVNAEREKVRQLEQMLIQQQNSPLQPNQPQQKKERSFWDRVFS